MAICFDFIYTQKHFLYPAYKKYKKIIHPFFSTFFSLFVLIFTCIFLSRLLAVSKSIFIVDGSDFFLNFFDFLLALASAYRYPKSFDFLIPHSIFSKLVTQDFFTHSILMCYVRYANDTAHTKIYFFLFI